MKMAAFIIIQYVPLIALLIGGTFASVERKREILYWAAEWIDCATRGLHDRMSEELDRLAASNR